MTDLENRQKAGQEVENRMREVILSYHPARGLSIDDLLYIAGTARAIAFDCFDFTGKL